MYYTHRETSRGRIERRNMDGTNPTILVSNNSSWPSGLAVNFTGQYFNPSLLLNINANSGNALIGILLMLIFSIDFVSNRNCYRYICLQRVRCTGVTVTRNVLSQLIWMDQTDEPLLLPKAM